MIGKILKALEKQGKERQAKLERQKRELEALRTGRAADAGAPTQLSASQAQPQVPTAASRQPGASQSSAREQLEALAAKRRAAIDELKRRRGEQAASTPASAPTKPTTPEQVLATMLGIPMPKPVGKPTGKGPARTNRGTSRPKPTVPPHQSGQPRSSDRGRVSQPEPQAPAPRAALRALEAQRVSEPVASVPEAVPTGTTPRSDPLGLRSLARSDLRRAIVLREIMDPPVTMRS